MPAPSPAPGANVPLTFVVALDGSAIPDTVAISSLQVGTTAGQAATAAITLLPGFSGLPALLASPWLAPGRTARIAAGYDGKNQTLFTGTIARLVLAPSAGNGAVTLVVECTGPAPIPATATSPVLSLTLGQDVLNFQLARASVTSGHIRFVGSAAARVGHHVTLAGFGAGFDGDLPVQGVAHEIREGLWTTTLALGPFTSPPAGQPGRPAAS